MTFGLLADIAVGLAIALPAIVFHEVAHGYVALLLGDTTARDRNRLSLNPFRHIDPFGTVLLPLLLLFMSNGQTAFGYAKPVPINPGRFPDYRKGMFLTGLAGPATNLVLAIVSALIFRVWIGTPAVGLFGGWVAYVLYRFCAINLILMFFNLIPLPPLDGSRVLPLFLSDRALRKYHEMERYGFVILLAVLWLAPSVLGFDPISSYFKFTVAPLLRLLLGV